MDGNDLLDLMEGFINTPRKVYTFPEIPKCCNQAMIKTSMCRYSSPLQHQYKCKACGKEEYVHDKE